METIAKITDIFERNAKRAFLVEAATREEVTYSGLYRDACSLGSFLSQKGLKKGDRVLILADNSVVLAKLYFGCLFAGIAVVPVNPVSTQEEIAYILKSSGAKLVINSSVLADMKKLPAAKNFKPFHQVSGEDDLFIIFTSGTSGEPKGVCHSIFDMIENGLTFAKTMGLGSESRFYDLLPMTYLGGYYNLLFIPFLSEGSVVIDKPFNAATVTNFWKPVIDHKVNTLWLVPTIMAMVLELDRKKDGANYCRDHVALAMCGTAPLASLLKSDFEKRYGVKVYENYGLSETFFITTNTPRSSKENIGVGRIIEGVKGKIVDQKNCEVSPGQEGEVVVQSPFLMKGYFNPYKGSPDLLSKQDWFPTGDIGMFENGTLFITGRKKDLIIRGGINISPTQIENVIRKQPGVFECAVVGIPHKIMGEEIAAIVRVDNGVDFERLKIELKDLCKGHLSAVKQPSHYLYLEQFPHTYSGKIQKNKLRSWAQNAVVENKNNAAAKPVGAAPPQAYYRASEVSLNSIQAISIKYNNMVYEMKRKGIDVTVLSLGEAFFDIPLFSFDDLPFPDIYHYSHSRGIPELRENLSKYFLTQYDVEFDPEKEIIVTTGSKAAIYMALMATLNQGDEALIHEPAWVSYFEQVKLCYGVPVRVGHDQQVSDFENYITPKTKVIIINNPNNPTGKIYTLDELSYLYKLAEQHNLFILSDETYSDFLLDGDQFISMANLDIRKTHTIICNSISKNYGISGWRLGYVITNGELTDQILKINQHLITCPSTILQYYVAKHFFEIIEITKPQIERVVKQRQQVARYMDKIGLEYLPGSATFYFFVSIEGSALTSEEFATRLLNEEHICVVPGIGYGDSCDGFVRVSVGTESIERIEQGLNKVKELIVQTCLK